MAASAARKAMTASAETDLRRRVGEAVVVTRVTFYRI
jgi:hypothetical protein